MHDQSSIWVMNNNVGSWNSIYFRNRLGPWQCEARGRSVANLEFVGTLSKIFLWILVWVLQLIQTLNAYIRLGLIPTSGEVSPMFLLMAQLVTAYRIRGEIGTQFSLSLGGGPCWCSFLPCLPVPRLQRFIKSRQRLLLFVMCFLDDNTECS